MIDSKIGERVMVSIHSEYGPFIRVSTYDDAGALEDLLDEKYFVLYWKSTPLNWSVMEGMNIILGMLRIL